MEVFQKVNLLIHFQKFSFMKGACNQIVLKFEMGYDLWPLNEFWSMF
jgi:hypothetical protein